MQTGRGGAEQGDSRGRAAVQASPRELSRPRPTLREPQEQPECGRGHSGDATEDLAGTADLLSLPARLPPRPPAQTALCVNTGGALPLSGLLDLG